jgi:hypothetical protein
MKERLYGADLDAVLPRADLQGTGDEMIRMDAFTARTNEFFRAKERREQRERNRG